MDMEKNDWTRVLKPKTQKKTIPSTEDITARLSTLKYTKHATRRAIERNLSIVHVMETISKAASGIGQMCLQEDGHLKFSYAYEFGDVYVVTDYGLHNVLSVWIRPYAVSA